MLSFSDEAKNCILLGGDDVFFYFWHNVLLLVESLAPSSRPTDLRLISWIYTTIFDMMLFFWHDVIFLRQKKITTALFFASSQTFDIVLLKKYIVLV